MAAHDHPTVSGSAETSDLHFALRRLAEIAVAWSAIPFDGHLALGHPSNGGLLLLDRSARPIWDYLRLRGDPASLLRDPVDRPGIEEFVAGCHAAGLFDDASTTPQVAPPTANLDNPSAAALDTVYICGDRPVRLRCADPWLSSLLGAVLRPCRSDAMPHADVFITGTGSEFHLFEDGRGSAMLSSLAAARNSALHRLIHLGRPDRRFTAVLHGAAVTRDGETLLLLGRSGSGKSTLAAGLLAGGWRLITDDLIPLEADANRVWTVPFALSVKEGSWPILSDAYPQLHRAPTLQASRRRVRYLDDIPRPPAAAALPVSALIFVRYDRQAAAAITPLSPVEALTELVATANTFPLEPQDRAALLAWLAARPAWRLTFATLSWAVDRVRATSPRGQTSEPPGGPESA